MAELPNMRQFVKMNPDNMSASPPGSLAIAGLGVAGAFSVTLDEEGYRGDLVMEIDSRDWMFRFSLNARDDLALMLSFLQEQAGRAVFSEIVVGTFFESPVRLIKDGEFEDRFWLRAWQGNSMVDFELLNEDVSEFTRALAGAVEDLKR